jgi:hypothetical protein
MRARAPPPFHRLFVLPANASAHASADIVPRLRSLPSSARATDERRKHCEIQARQINEMCLVRLVPTITHRLPGTAGGRSAIARPGASAPEALVHRPAAGRLTAEYPFGGSM